MHWKRTKLDNGTDTREREKQDRGRRVTRNFLINSINVSFDRSIVGTFYSCSRRAKTTENGNRNNFAIRCDMNADDDDDGGERQYVNIDSCK